MKRYLSCYYILVCLITFLLSGCGSGNSDRAPSDISGTWSGTVSADGSIFAIAIAIQQSGGNISGNYVTNLGDSTLNGPVEGTYSSNGAELAFKYSGYTIATASLTFSGDKAKGTIILLITDDSGNLDLTKE